MGLAHWDGDTLVIDSVGFGDRTWLGWEGYFHTDKMEVTERFTRNGDLLYYNFTVKDPDVLMEPWTSYTYVRRLNPNHPNCPGRYRHVHRLRRLLTRSPVVLPKFCSDPGSDRVHVLLDRERSGAGRVRKTRRSTT